MTEEQFNELKTTIKIRLKCVEEEIQYYEGKNERAFQRYVEGRTHAYKNVLADIDRIMSE